MSDHYDRYNGMDKLGTDLAQLGTNLASLGTDCISRQAAIDAFDCTNELIVGGAANAQNVVNYINKVVGKIKGLPSAQPEIIRCRNCKFASGDSRICMQFGHSPIGELDFCAWAERRNDE